MLLVKGSVDALLPAGSFYREWASHVVKHTFSVNSCDRVICLGQITSVEVMGDSGGYWIPRQPCLPAYTPGSHGAQPQSADPSLPLGLSRLIFAFKLIKDTGLQSPFSRSSCTVADGLLSGHADLLFIKKTR